MRETVRSLNPLRHYDCDDSDDIIENGLVTERIVPEKASKL